MSSNNHNIKNSNSKKNSKNNDKSNRRDADKSKSKKEDKSKNLKMDASSDDGGDFMIEEDEEEDSEEEDEDSSEYETLESSDDEEEEDTEGTADDFDKKEFRKTLVSLFPSTYVKNKYKKELDSEEEEDEEEEKPKKHKKNTKGKASSKDKDKHTKKTEKPKKIEKSQKTDKKNKHKKNKKHRSSEEDEDDEEEESLGSEDSSSDFLEEEEEDEETEKNNAAKTLSLIFSMGGLGGGAGAAGADVFEEYEQLRQDDKHETCDSDDEKTFMKESYIPIAIPPSTDTVVNESVSSDTSASNRRDSPYGSKSEKKHKNKNNQTTNQTKHKSSKKEEKIPEKKEKTEKDQFDKKYAELVQLKKELTEQLERKPGSKILRNAIQDCRDSIAKLIKRTRNKNTKAYFKLVNGEDEEKQNNSELTYFKKKCSHKEQLKIMQDLQEINTFTNVDKPYRLSLLESNIPSKFKAVVLQKLKVLKTMEPGDSEYFKLKTWVDGFMRVPFGIYKSLSITIADGMDKCNDFLENAKTTLDNCAYGLNDAKLQILQMVGQWMVNPGAVGSSIAIHGPPGTGKTTIVKDGISKILGREFAFIALGGAGDSSFLEGHSYTYEGSSWGKILQILMDSRCMNPVIYFDELDKISDTPRGEEITNILVHLTDITQNDEYHDKYFSEVSFRLSQCLFIFSYNDESKVNPILKDRMYRIHTKGYDAKEKMIIARKHLLPKIREQVRFAEDELILPDETLQYIISSQNLCKGEQGVRNLKRCLEIIYTKLNLFRLVRPDSKVFEKDIHLGEVVFPFTVEKKHVDILIKTEEPLNHSMLAMYV